MNDTMMLHVQVKFIHDAMKAHSGSRGIALLFP